MQHTENRTSEEVAQELVYGKKLTFKLPSGYEVTIREQNGNDDDILSNQSTAKDLSNLNIFIASLVVETNLPFAVNGKLTSELVKKMVIRDKYFILIKSRIHSIGSDLRITYDWGKDEGGKIEYIEDLNRYVWDYNTEFPEEGTENYDPERIEPYIIPGVYDKQELTLRSGKHLKFNLLNGHSETQLMKLPLDQMTRNAELKARNLEMFVSDTWVKVENFSMFTKHDMAELNKMVKIADPSFNAVTDLSNPNTGETIKFPIMGTLDFFYPEEI